MLAMAATHKAVCRLTGLQGRRVSGNGNTAVFVSLAGRHGARIDDIVWRDPQTARRGVGHSCRGRCGHRSRCRHVGSRRTSAEHASGRLFGAAGMALGRSCEATRWDGSARFEEPTGTFGFPADDSGRSYHPGPPGRLSRAAKRKGPSGPPGTLHYRSNPFPMGPGAYRAPGRVRNRGKGGRFACDRGRPWSRRGFSFRPVRSGRRQEGQSGRKVLTAT